MEIFETSTVGLGITMMLGLFTNDKYLFVPSAYFVILMGYSIWKTRNMRNIDYVENSIESDMENVSSD